MPWTWWALFLFLSTGLASPVYPIDWVSVPIDTEQPADIDVENTDIGPCICDLTLNYCDPNCRCDQECSETEKAQFSGSLPEGPVPTQVRSCMDRDLVEINARGGLHTAFFDRLVCVVTDNNPTKGRFHRVPEPVTDTRLEQLRSLNPYSYQIYIPPEPARTSGSYFVGDPLVTKINGDPYTLPYSLPQPDFTNQCSERHIARYLIPLPSSSCTRVVTNLASECALGSSSSLAAHPFVANRQVGQFRETATFLPLVVRSLQYYDPVTGTTTDLAPGSLPSPSWDGGSCTCSNVLKSLHLTVNFLASGEIAGWSADVLLTSLQPPACAPTAALTQTFSLLYNDTDSMLGPPVPKSGNPGYRVGLPLLVGQRVSNGASKTAIQQEVNGMEVLPADEYNQCLPPSPGAFTGKGTLLTFGEDRAVSCQLSLTLAQLESLCNSGGVFSYLNISNEWFFGKWGNSDYRYVNQWTQLTRSDPLDTPVWNPNTRTCSLTAQANFEFAWAFVGHVENSQRTLLRAHLGFTTVDWTFIGADVNRPQPFTVGVSVTWLQSPVAEEDYTPEGPPIFPRFPSDLLYPLQIAAAPRSSLPAASSLSLLLSHSSLTLLSLLLSTLLS